MGIGRGVRSAFVAGVLSANSAPHLVTAARRDRMLTPLAGPESGPLANLAWGTINLSAAVAMMVRASRRLAGRSGGLLAFTAGATAFAVWAVVYETATSRRE